MFILLSISVFSFDTLSIPIQFVSYNPDMGETSPLANKNITLIFLNQSEKQTIELKTNSSGFVELPLDKVNIVELDIQGVYLLSSTYGLRWWSISSNYIFDKNITSFRFRTPLVISKTTVLKLIDGKILEIDNVNPFTGKRDVYIRPMFPAYRTSNNKYIVSKGSRLYLYFEKNISLNTLFDKWRFIGFNSRNYFIYYTITNETGKTSTASLFTKYMIENIKYRLTYEINYLEDIGFTLPHINKSIIFIQVIFDSAYSAFINNNIDTGVFLFNRGINKLSETLEFIENLRSDSFAIVVVLVLITFFLSTIISQLSKRRFTAQVLAFIILFIIEVFTFPQFKLIYYTLLVSSGKSYSSESVSQSAVVETILKLFIGFIFLGLLFFGFRNSKVSDFFNYSIKNLGRRKARSIIVLLTIAIVSSSAVMFTSINISSKKEITIDESNFNGTGIVIRRHVSRIIASKTSQNVVFLNYYEPLLYSESKWLINQVPNVKSYSFYTYSKITLGKNIVAYIVISNFTYLNEIGFTKYIIGNYSGKGILINGKLSKTLRVSKNNKIFFGNYTLLIGGIFSNDAIEFKNIDGEKYFEKIPSNSNIILINWKDLQKTNIPVYRVDIILSNPINYGKLANYLFYIGYDKKYKETYLGGEAAIEYTYKSYELTYINEGSVYSEYLGREVVGFESTTEFIIPLIIASLVVAITQLGSVYDRKREIVTISTLGASPLDIIFMLIVEGFAYGIIGGLLGYILGGIITVYLKPPITVSVSPQSLSPMLTVIFVALAPAIIGCLIPARKIVLEAVPSKLLLKEKGIHLKIEKDKAILLMPIRLYGEESLFSEYLSYLEKQPIPSVEGLIFKNHVVNKEDGRYTIDVEVHYKGSRYAEYIVLFKIPNNRKENIECIITPKEGVWKPEHKIELNNLALAIRERLINYVDWKKKKLKLSH